MTLPLSDDTISKWWGLFFNKFMQYQIVDPPDVVVWTFMNGIEVGQFEERGVLERRLLL